VNFLWLLTLYFRYYDVVTLWISYAMLYLWFVLLYLCCIPNDYSLLSFHGSLRLSHNLLHQKTVPFNTTTHTDPWKWRHFPSRLHQPIVPIAYPNGGYSSRTLTATPTANDLLMLVGHIPIDIHCQSCNHPDEPSNTRTSRITNYFDMLIDSLHQEQEHMLPRMIAGQLSA